LKPAIKMVSRALFSEKFSYLFQERSADLDLKKEVTRLSTITSVFAHAFESYPLPFLMSVGILIMRSRELPGFI